MAKILVVASFEYAFRRAPSGNKTTENQTSVQPAASGRAPSNSSAAVVTAARAPLFKSEVLRRIALIDDYDAVIVGPGWDAYLVAFQHLAIEWEWIIRSKGAPGYAAELREFNASVASALNTIADVQRKHGYYQDINSRVGGAYPFQGKLSPAIKRLLDALALLPSNGAGALCKLIEPQQSDFKAAVNEYGSWIQGMQSLLATMRSEELANPTKD